MATIQVVAGSYQGRPMVDAIQDYQPGCDGSLIN
jgi:hypothetical protein